MTTTFGRRAAAASVQTPALRPPPPGAVDPRMEALAASLRDGDGSRAELDDYLARRRAVIGPWTWLANGLHVAVPVASYVLHAPWAWVGVISAASVGSRFLLKRGRLRWAAELEAQARSGPHAGDPI